MGAAQSFLENVRNNFVAKTTAGTLLSPSLVSRAILMPKTSESDIGLTFNHKKSKSKYTTTTTPLPVPPATSHTVTTTLPTTSTFTYTKTTANRRLKAEGHTTSLPSTTSTRTTTRTTRAESPTATDRIKEEKMLISSNMSIMGMWLLIVLLIVISRMVKIQCVKCVTCNFLKRTEVWLSDIISHNDDYCYQIEHKTKSSKSGHKGNKNKKRSKPKAERSTAAFSKTVNAVNVDVKNNNNNKSQSLIDGEANDLQLRAKTPIAFEANSEGLDAVLDETSSLETQQSIDLNYLDNKSMPEKDCLDTVDDLYVNSTFDDDIEECK